MRIGILSDIHDNIWALERALAAVHDCDTLFVLGDLCAAFTLEMIADSFDGPIHLVWGNNDGDRYSIGQKAAQGNVTVQGEFGELILDGRRIALTHYPHVARALAAGGGYDLVCHGHDHQRVTMQVKKTLLLNPGEVMGRSGVNSVAIYDTATGAAEIVTV